MLLSNTSVWFQCVGRAENQCHKCLFSPRFCLLPTTLLIFPRLSHPLLYFQHSTWMLINSPRFLPSSYCPEVTKQTNATENTKCGWPKEYWICFSLTTSFPPLKRITHILWPTPLWLSPLPNHLIPMLTKIFWRWLHPFGLLPQLSPSVYPVNSRMSFLHPQSILSCPSFSLTRIELCTQWLWITYHTTDEKVLW